MPHRWASARGLEGPAARAGRLCFLYSSLDREAYAGRYRCRDEMMWLHPAGVFAFRGATGSWMVSAPGVVRLFDHEGKLVAKAAIEPDRTFCREAW